jgi:hypothetical protein
VIKIAAKRVPKFKAGKQLAKLVSKIKWVIKVLPHSQPAGITWTGILATVLKILPHEIFYI